jgi:hypothetical protein
MFHCIFCEARASICFVFNLFFFGFCVPPIDFVAVFSFGISVQFLNVWFGNAGVSVQACFLSGGFVVTFVGSMIYFLFLSRID